MMDRTVYKNGKELRYGYTTGSCAAAAAKAAVFMLRRQEPLDSIQIATPKGWDLDLSVHHAFVCSDRASCSVQKDSGDDIDATDGVHIYAEVSWKHEGGIEIIGGKGVGRVTRAGIGLAVGQAAINKVPQAMIRDEVSKVLPEGNGVTITFTIPEGEEIAKRTFNPQLGIQGGLSIIGTSGIVEPMSEESFKESLALDLKMNGLDHNLLVYVPGNYGYDFCTRLGVPEERIFKTSNFVGYMLEQAMKHELPRILLVGHIGKFAKLAAGNFHTHNRVSDGRRETITAYAAMEGVDRERLDTIFQATTTEAMIQALTVDERDRIFFRMAQMIQERISRFVFDQIKIEVILFSMEKGLLGQTDHAVKWMEELKNECY